MAMAVVLRGGVRHLLRGKTKQLLVTSTIHSKLNFSTGTGTGTGTGTITNTRLEEEHEYRKQQLEWKRRREEYTRLMDEIVEEVKTAHSIDKVCPLLGQQYDERVKKQPYNFKSLESFLEDIRSYNSDNKDAPRKPYRTSYKGGPTHYDYNNLASPAEIEQDYRDREEKRLKLAHQMAHTILNQFNNDQSIRCGQKMNWEYVRLVTAAEDYHPLFHYIVVEASNPDAAAAAAAGFPTTIRLEATYNWYTGETPTPKYRSPPYIDNPPSLAKLKPQVDKVVPFDEHNVALSTQAGSDPIILDKTYRRRELGKFDDEAELKELRQFDEKESEKKSDDDNLTAHEKVLGTGHPKLRKGGKRSRAEMQSGFQQIREDTKILRNEMKSLKEESLRKEQEAKEREERLETKLQLIMDKLHLMA